MIMKKVLFCCFILVFSLVLSLLLQSCYAFLKADKLVYSGNVFKKPTTTTVVNDTVLIENQE